MDRHGGSIAPLCYKSPTTTDATRRASAPLHDTRLYQPLLDAYLRDRVGDAEVDLRIAAADPLLRYLERIHLGVESRAVCDYFRGGWSAHRLLRQLLRLRFGDAAASASILDFGSGWGRTTRFLVREHQRDRIAVADVMEDAVAFQREAFGVRDLVTPADPSAWRLSERFDLIFAISVFTHFNPDDFAAWLERLRALVAPDGMLVFTVNDASLLLPGRTLDAAATCFEPESENQRLDTRRYGSTWVAESFVARVLAGAAYRRLPRALWASQDVYVVAAGGAPLPDPLPMRLEPAGRLEAAAFDDHGVLTLRGWAAMPTGEAVESVAAWIDGRHAGATTPDLARDDVAQRLHGERAGEDAGDAAGDAAGDGEDARERAGAAPGFNLRLEPPAGGFNLSQIATVTATSRDGVEFVLHHDSLAATLAFPRIEELHATVARLEHEVRRRDLELGRQKEIAGALWWGTRNRHLELRALKQELEVSRFWKLRNRWWAAKRRLRDLLGAGKDTDDDAPEP